MNTNNMFDVETINLEFEIFWQTLKSDFTIPANPRTGQSVKVKVINGVEKLVTNRKVKGIFRDEFSLKPTVRRRFFVTKTGFYPDGTKATSFDVISMTTFKRSYKQYYKYFNTPIFTPSDMYEVKKTLNDIKKLVNIF